MVDHGGQWVIIIGVGECLWVYFREFFKILELTFGLFLLEYFKLSIKSLSITEYGQSFLAIFTILSVLIWFSMRTLGIFITLVYIITVCVGIFDTLNIAIISTLWTSMFYLSTCMRNPCLRTVYRQRKWPLPVPVCKIIALRCKVFY